MTFSKSIFQFALLIILFTGCSNSNRVICIYSGSEDPEIQFAADEIKSALTGLGFQTKLSDQGKADIALFIEKGNNQIKAEGFSIQKSNNKIGITGADAAGVMYGGLELAEQIKLYGLEGVQQTLQNPYMEKRGTKFNIPLDVRTPSYTDVSDAAQKNIPEMWNFEFWKEYIDNLARYRYNFISLWSLHPFPSMVKVPDYPEVALDDVQRSTVNWEENYNLNGIGFDAPEILANPEIVKKFTIEEKIEFWQKVMKYAKCRNIDFFVVTWNIFVNGTDGKYGITDDIKNETTRNYFRKSVKQMFLTYPDLAGIGLTTGENMNDASTKEKEDWAFETYAQGLLDVAKEQPNRKFTFIHRQHQTGAPDIAKKFAPLTESGNIEFLFSFKYAQAHVFSCTLQPFHENFIKEIEGNKTIWTLRNDDNYYFRWGAPDFVREFIKNIPKDVSSGFYYGSDQYVWGREFLSKNPESPRQIEIVKHWYHWMMWGRLGYNPDIPDERFIHILQNKYSGTDAKKLFTAWQEASIIYPVTTGFHWGPLDFQWYIEACKSRPEYAKTTSGFHDVNRFISLPPHPKTGYMAIPDFVEMTVKKETSGLISPIDVSKQIHTQSDKTIELLMSLNAGQNKELKQVLNDIQAMAYLGKYYAFKIRGATELALFRVIKKKEYQDEAVNQLTQALDYWKKYTETAMEQNINPLWTNRVGIVDWVKLTSEVEKDIEIAKANL